MGRSFSQKLTFSNYIKAANWAKVGKRGGVYTPGEPDRGGGGGEEWCPFTWVRAYMMDRNLLGGGGKKNLIRLIN